MELYIDFDGVIMDTIPYLDEALEKCNIDFKDELSVYKFLSDFDYLPYINDKYIINEAMNRIKKIIDSKKFNISILTHVCSLKEGMDKIEYIRKYFKDITIILVPRLISKTKLVHTDGAILIDDKTFNLTEWESEGGIPIKFSKDKKESKYKCVNYLDEILEIL